MKWQPISSAPKNVPVLITDGKIVTGGILDDYGWDVIGVVGYEWEMTFTPTHWMLRPEPPK